MHTKMAELESSLDLSSGLFGTQSLRQSLLTKVLSISLLPAFRNYLDFARFLGPVLHGRGPDKLSTDIFYWYLTDIWSFAHTDFIFMNFLKSSQKTSLLNRVRACILRKRRNKADLERTSSINLCRRLVKKNCQLVPSPRSSQEISLKYRGKSCSKKPQAHAFSGELQERPTEENSVTKSFWTNHSTVLKTSYEGWNSVRMCARLDWYSSHKRF